MAYLMIEVYNLVWLTSENNAVHIYRIGGSIRFLMSACFHWYGCVLEWVYKSLAIGDYMGITVFILCGGISYISSIPGFDDYSKHGFRGLIASIACGIAVMALGDDFHTASKRALRSLLFAGFGFSIFGVCVIAAYSAACVQCFDDGLATALICVLVGVCIYALRIPERFFSFWAIHVFLQSHILFHSAVAIGSAMFYCFLYRLGG